MDAVGDTRNHLLCVIGDTHGHLQLGLCVAARWQQESNVSFDAVLLCGDVGTFIDESQLDSTTRRHAKANPCELEFLKQWASEPPARWLHKIFLPVDDGGLGLECPVVMVHGNHEGFPHLFELAAMTSASTLKSGKSTHHGSRLSPPSTTLSWLRDFLPFTKSAGEVPSDAP